MGLTEIMTEQDWLDKVKMAQGKVLVEFFAQWCGFCKREQPILEAEAATLEAAGTKVYQVDIDRFPELATEFGVNGTPTFVLFDNGQPVGEQVGLMEAPQLVAFAA